MTNDEIDACDTAFRILRDLTRGTFEASVFVRQDGRVSIYLSDNAKGFVKHCELADLERPSEHPTPGAALAILDQKVPR